MSRATSKKTYLYSVGTDDKRFTPVFKEDLETKNGFHNWWYKLMDKGDNRPTTYKDKDGKTIHLNDILLIPNHDFNGEHYSWSVVVAMVPEKYSRFENEDVILKTIHIGWDHRIRIGKPEKERLRMTAYTDECMIVGKLKDIIESNGYLKEYNKTIQSPDGKSIS